MGYLSTGNWDIFISYNHKSGKHYAKKLRALFNDNWYTVWMDTSNMRNEMTSTIAKGIAHSKLVLLLISKSYEESHMCEAEYNHAFYCGKIIIPIKVEDYHPPNDTGLGFIISNKIYYELYKNNDDEYNKIFKACKEIIESPDTSLNQATDDNAFPNQTTGTHTSPHQATGTYISPHQATGTYTSPNQATSRYISRNKSTRTYTSSSQSTCVHSSGTRSTRANSSRTQSTSVHISSTPSNGVYTKRTHSSDVYRSRTQSTDAYSSRNQSRSVWTSRSQSTEEFTDDSVCYYSDRNEIIANHGFYNTKLTPGQADSNLQW